MLLSLGGASGAYGFKSDDEGKTFAKTLWDLFGGGDSKTRPFGDSIVDGFDLDIEGGGSTGYVVSSSCHGYQAIHKWKLIRYLGNDQRASYLIQERLFQGLFHHGCTPGNLNI